MTRKEITEPETPPRPGARQRRKSADMRQRVLVAATHALAEDGYEGTSIKRVVVRAGVSQGALQYHFPSKEELMASVAARLLARAVRWAEQAGRELAGEPDALARLIRRSWAEQFRTPDYAALLELMTTARTDPALRARIAPELRGWYDEFEGLIGGALRPLAADGEALVTITTISRCLMSGLLVQDMIAGREASVPDILDRWIAMVSDWLSARAAGGANSGKGMGES
ncbi:TetR/AcrR family transcriptional regulator [Yunchengibacter salinarum]|uniref:TetR/AcrR family transcriptional regulator n=1 Tax=Yunchengibacter salinarum TaxID=3133399 RepID=UPI0035B631E9